MTVDPPLRAVTRPLDRDLDLVDVAGAGADGVLFERGADGLAGRGRALRIPLTGNTGADLASVDRALGEIVVDDTVGRPGCGPVAFGAIPFDRSAGVDLVIPALIVGRAADGTRWITRVGRGDLESGLAEAAAVPVSGAVTAGVGDGDLVDSDRPRAATFQVRATQDAHTWMDTVSLATKRIARGDFEKVVLAREVEVTADAPLPRQAILQRLRRAFPGCFTFSVGTMVGASPELLVSRSGDTVRAHPMAGTAPRGGDPATDARLAASLLASAKDRGEHQITIDMVWETLLPFCSYVDSEPEPSIVAVANVQHLATLVEGRLSSPAASVLELVDVLHPTPAVAGWPVSPAIDFLREHEGIDRDTYAGAVGWVDAAGNGTWAVGIRSAIIEGRHARLFAGVGVVADSDPHAELAETEAKFQAVLSAIVRP